ncbi:hypothetical protein [Actinomyces vulturis]|uniref:hypothetical protein n=1 Tax=Actinomyces vulturis TaxID=1857645 RepID=UPI00083101E0|nr:hypothetical protein [Actinomyces vulturis]
MPSTPAPRPRRWDHIGAIIIGICLVPMIFIFSSWSVRSVMTNDDVTAVLVIVLITAFILQANAFFAHRSSIGGTVTGLTMAFTSMLAMLAPTTLWRVGHESGVVSVFDYATGWICACLFFGGSIAMRRARRHGRNLVIDSRRHTDHDQTVGTIPIPPPSRRPDHIVSGLVSLVGLSAGLPLMTSSYTSWIGPDTSAFNVLTFFISAFILIITASVGGRSSLGPRLVGTVAFILPIPSILGCHASWCLLGQWFIHSPAPITTMLSGAILMSTGWGAHWARSRGQREQRALMSVAK